MRGLFVYALLHWLTGLAISAQDQRRLTITVHGCENDTLFLAGYYGHQLYYSDSALANSEGTAVFEKARGYKAGVYAVVTRSARFFELLVNEPTVDMESDTADLPGHVVVHESLENQLFVDHIRRIDRYHRSANVLDSLLMAATTTAERSRLKTTRGQLDSTVLAYKREQVTQHGGTYFACVVAISLPPDPTGDAYHEMAHYWDNVDLSDARIVRTPSFGLRFDAYLAKLLHFSQDSMNACVDDLIHRMDGPELFKFAVEGIRKLCEYDWDSRALWRHMAHTYYCPENGSASRVTWLDPVQRMHICERAR